MDAGIDRVRRRTRRSPVVPGPPPATLRGNPLRTIHRPVVRHVESLGCDQGGQNGRGGHHAEQRAAGRDVQGPGHVAACFTRRSNAGGRERRCPAVGGVSKRRLALAGACMCMSNSLQATAGASKAAAVSKLDLVRPRNHSSGKGRFGAPCAAGLQCALHPLPRARVRTALRARERAQPTQPFRET